MTTSHEVDGDFLDLPLDGLSAAALDRARALGAGHADVRVQRLRSQLVRLKDGQLQGSNDGEDLGIGVRVIHEGAWGFAATADLTAEAAIQAAEDAVALARVSRPLSTEQVELAAEPVHVGVHVSSYSIDPFDVPDSDKVALLESWSRALLASPAVDHVDAMVYAVKENTFYADLAGTRTTQQRVRLNGSLTAVAIDPATGAFETMGTVAPPVGRGWEYLDGDGLGLGSRARGAPRPLGGQAGGAVGRARPLRPGHRPVQPVAHDPRVGRPRDRAGSCARLRGELRGNLLRHLRPAGLPPVRLRA